MSGENKITITSDQKKDTEKIADKNIHIMVNGVPINERRENTGVDLVFVIDTTGSMSDKIEGLLATCAKFTDQFSALKLNHRIAIIAFGDLLVPGDEIKVTSFTDNIEITKKSLKNIPRFGGGGNEGESSLEALEKAIELNYRENIIKVILLITDEPAHQNKVTSDFIIKKLNQYEFLVFVVSPAIQYFKRIAETNGGKWYQVSATTDFSDLLDVFGQIAQKVAHAVSDVYKLGGGSVSNYLRLKPPED